MVDARSLSTILQDFRGLAERANRLSVGDTGEAAMNKMKDWLAGLQEDRDWLLIFDGANDPAMHLETFFPSGGRGAILVTTTSPALQALCGFYETIAGLDSDSATDLILTTAMEDVADNNNRLLAQEISQKYEGLPLVILNAGSMIRNGHCTLENFLDKVQTYQHQSFMVGESPGSNSSYHRVYRTWDACRKMIQELNTQTSIDAVDILTLCALVDHKQIPFKLFEQMPPRPRSGKFVSKIWSKMYPSSRSVGSVENATWDPDRLREAVMMLTNYSLALFDRRSSKFSIHRSVHQWLSLDLKHHGGSSVHSWAKAAVSHGLTRNINLNQRAHEHQAERFVLFPHVKTFLQQDFSPFKMYELDDALAAETYAFLYFDTGHYDLAEDSYRKCICFYTTSGKSNEERYFNGLVGLAEVLERRNQFMEALELSREAKRGLAMLTHTSASKCRQVLALCLMAVNQVEAAKEELLGLLDTPGQRSSPLEESTLETVAILVEVLRRNGDLADAIKRGEENYENRKRVLKAQHPDTLESARTLATTLCQHGSRLDDAAEIMEHVCKSRETTLGTNHPDTILSLSSLAKIFKQQGKYDRAEEEQMKALCRLTEVQGPDDPDAIAMINNLGDLCLKRHRFEEAEAQFRMAYEGYLANDNIGRGHNFTLTAKINVALSVQNQGKLEEANGLYNEVMEDCVSSGKESSPDALHCMMNQSILYIMLEDFGSAEALGKRAAEGYKVSHGPKSMAYCRALMTVSSAICSQQQYQKSEEVVRTALKGFADARGPGDAETLEAIALLAEVLSRQGREGEALDLFREASDGFKKLGDDQHWCHEKLRDRESKS